MNLQGDDPAVKQALVDAGERYNAAGSQLERPTSAKQYALARETALEGLAFIRAARTAMGLDPGPDLPQLAAQREAGMIRQDRAVEVDGREYRASPRYGDDTPYYYPGGIVRGRRGPGGVHPPPGGEDALPGRGGALRGGPPSPAPLLPRAWVRRGRPGRRRDVRPHQQPPLGLGPARLRERGPHSVEDAGVTVGQLVRGRPRGAVHRTVAPPGPHLLGHERQERREQPQLYRQG